MKFLLKYKFIISAVVVILIYIYTVFFYVDDRGGTIFGWRDYERRKEFVLNKEFEKLQAYVIIRDRNQMSPTYGTTKTVEVEEWCGGKTKDICLILKNNGVFTKEFYDNMEHEAKSRDATEESLEIAKQGQKLFIEYVVDNMSSDLLLEMWAPVWGMVKVKRKWYHYFLF